jgi:hypothetical protein
MDYIRWNDNAGNYFFNESNHGSLVNLYASKEIIIEIGRKDPLLETKSDDKIWEDFMEALRKGCDGKVDNTNLIETLSIIDKYYNSCLKYKNLSNETVPYYFLYLVAVIVALNSENSNNDSPYEQINGFFLFNNRTINHLAPQIPKQNWNKYWDDLSRWSKSRKFGEFKIPQVRNGGWVYMIKPLSQLIISPKVAERICEMFYKYGWQPNQNLNDENWNVFIKENLQKLQRGSRVDFGNLENEDLVSLTKPYLENKFKNYTPEVYRNLSQKKDRIKCKLLLGYSQTEKQFYFRAFTSEENDTSIKKGEFLVAKLDHKSCYSEKIDVNSILFNGNELNHDFSFHTDTHVLRYKKKDVLLLVPESDLGLSENNWLEDEYPLGYCDFLLFFGEGRRSEILNQLGSTDDRPIEISSNITFLNFFMKLSWEEVNLLSELLNFRKLKTRLQLNGGWRLERYKYIINYPPRITTTIEEVSPWVQINNELIEIPRDTENNYKISRDIKRQILQLNPPRSRFYLQGKPQFTLQFERIKNLLMKENSNMNSFYSNYDKSDGVTERSTEYRNSLLNRSILNNFVTYGRENLSPDQFIERHNSSFWGKRLVYFSALEKVELDKSENEKKMKDSKSFIRSLELTAHAYYDNKRYILEDPFAYEITGYFYPGTRTSILCGRRDITFLKQLWELSNQVGIITKIEIPELNLRNNRIYRVEAPPEIRFHYQDQNDFLRFCNLNKIKFNPKLHLPSAIVLKERSLGEFEKNLGTAITNFNNQTTLQYYDFETNQYSHHADALNGLRLIKLKNNNKIQYLIEDGYKYLVAEDFMYDFEAWALLYIANEAGLNNIFKYDHSSKTLHVQRENFLPKIFRKSLVMNGGTISNYFQSKYESQLSLPIKFQNADYHSLKYALSTKLNQKI